MLAKVVGWLVSLGRKSPPKATSQYRQKILGLEEWMKTLPDAVQGDSEICPLEHTFADGIYIRQITMPAGYFVVSKIHKHTHPYFVLKGRARVMTEDGVKIVSAPYHGITKAGTKRLLYIEEESVWVTIHATKETDLEKIEDEVIAKSFDEIKDGATPIEMAQELRLEDTRCLGRR